MAKARLTVHQIRHSGLVRARETAEILGNVLNPPGGVIAVAGLKFSDPVDTLARELRLEPEPVMLVGHNPFMEDLASMLLIGEPVTACRYGSPPPEPRALSTTTANGPCAGC